MIVRYCDLGTGSMKMCNRGAREFFARHGLNWQSFIEHGIDDSELSHIDDAMMQQVIERARERTARGG